MAVSASAFQDPVTLAQQQYVASLGETAVPAFRGLVGGNMLQTRTGAIAAPTPGETLDAYQARTGINLNDRAFQEAQTMVTAYQKQLQAMLGPQGTGGTAAAGTAAPAPLGSSYFGQAPQINMGGAWGPTSAGGAWAAPSAGAGAVAPTSTSAAVPTSAGASNMAGTTASQFPTGMWGGGMDPASLREWQKWFGQNAGKTILVNGQPRTINQDITPDQLYKAFQSNTVSSGTIPGAQAPAAPIGGAGQPQPESAALQQMAQIDPATEALRQRLAQSYLSPLATAGNVPMPRTPQMGPPQAGDVQSYLDLYRQIDPTGLAARQKLGSDLAAQEALGTKLDPAMQREVEQATRRAQIARGNVYGTPQLVQEAMTRGSAGLALQQQRQQALQGYLSSGQDVGSVAQNMYQQGLSNYANQYNQYLGAWQTGQANQRAAQQAALGYLGSGSTPYQAGASYLNTAEQRAAAAAQGGAAFQPQGPSPYYTGAGTSSFPQYGLDMSQLGNQYMQGMNYANLTAYGMTPQNRNQAGGAAAGALSGAASGALAGSAAGPYGTLIGGAVGALGGAAKGYFS